MKIETKQGSATDARPDHGDPYMPPSVAKGVIIAHLANSVGGWGSGFVLAVNDLSPIPRMAYKELAKRHKKNIPLGETQFCEVEPHLWVSNMVAQNGIDKSVVANGCLVDYNALDTCLKLVFTRAVLLKCDVHIPDGIGSGLAGGSKSLIMDIIKTVAESSNILALEKQMNFVPTITLWEFTDTTAASYVAPAAPASPVVAGVDQALADFSTGDRGIDLSEDDV